MTNNQLTDPANQLTAEQLVTLQLRIMSALSFYRQRPEKEARRMAELLELAGAAASELQEHRKAAAEPIASDEHVRREVNVGGNTWVQCSKHAYDKAKAEGKIVRELYERSQLTLESALEMGMARYGDAMQKLADGDN